jgi:hypothetical protein
LILGSLGTLFEPGHDGIELDDARRSLAGTLVNCTDQELYQVEPGAELQQATRELGEWIKHRLSPRLLRSSATPGTILLIVNLAIALIAVALYERSRPTTLTALTARQRQNGPLILPFDQLTPKGFQDR